MKLLFDQNLSPRLISRLSAFYPEAIHVSEVGLARARDSEVWEFARDEGLIIVSKDTDFSEMSVVRGFPPKVIWIRRGNCSTDEIADILRRDIRLVAELEANPNLGILLLY